MLINDQKKLHETLAVKMKRSLGKVYSVRILNFAEKWMLILSDLEVQIYIFNKTKEKILLINERKECWEN